MSKHIETEFKNWLLSKSSLNKDHLVRKSGERPAHLRLSRGCGIEQFSELTSLLESLSLSYDLCDNYTGSPTYKGHGVNVNWQGHTVGVLLAVAKDGHVERKKYTPKKLGLTDIEFTDSSVFRNLILAGLDRVESDVSIRECLVSMIDNVQNKTPITNHPFLKVNTNRITSDFGETLAAYESSLKGNTILFPDAGNNNIADYYENGVPVSAKGRKTGGKINLSSYTSLIDRTTVTGEFLYSIATHDQSGFFAAGAKLCPEAEWLARRVGGTSKGHVENYINTVTYDMFYDPIKADPRFKGLGIPEEGRPRELWMQGDTNPFYFTLNTFMNRLWGDTAESSSSITPIVSKFLTEPKFVHIDIVDYNVVTYELPFVDVGQWRTAYWSRATKAWHNWMAVEPVRK